MQLFGKDIILTDKLCVRPPYSVHMSGYPGLLNKPFVNLYVKITDRCNAHCPFCCNDSEHTVSSTLFNADKLFYVIHAIVSNGIKLNRISLTGGEPSLCPERVLDLLQRISESEECAFTQVQLNTNGLNNDSLILIRHPRLDSISVSLHHYDKEKLSALYGRKIEFNPIAETKDIADKLNISCNLIKGYIDSTKEIERMIHYAESYGVKTIGFVSLISKNKYCEERFIDFRKIDLSTIPSLILSAERALLNICGCKNYLYTGKNNPIDVYFRINDNPMYCGSSLLYDGVYLRQGFNNDNIIY